MLKKWWKRIFAADAEGNDDASCPLQFDQRSRRRLLWTGRLGRSR